MQGKPPASPNSNIVDDPRPSGGDFLRAGTRYRSYPVYISVVLYVLVEGS